MAAQSELPRPTGGELLAASLEPVSPQQSTAGASLSRPPPGPRQRPSHWRQLPQPLLLRQASMVGSWGAGIGDRQPHLGAAAGGAHSHRTCEGAANPTSQQPTLLQGMPPRLPQPQPWKTQPFQPHSVGSRASGGPGSTSSTCSAWTASCTCENDQDKQQQAQIMRGKQCGDQKTPTGRTRRVGNS